MDIILFFGVLWNECTLHKLIAPLYDVFSYHNVLLSLMGLCVFVAKREWIMCDSYLAIRAKEQDHWECQFEYKRMELIIYSQKKMCLWAFVCLKGAWQHLIDSVHELERHQPDRGCFPLSFTIEAFFLFIYLYIKKLCFA